MSFQTLVLQRLSQLNELYNSLVSNSKKIEELPAQTSLDLSSKFAVSRAGVSEHIPLELLATAFANNTYNRILSIDGEIDVTGTDITVPPISWEIDLTTYTKATDSVFSLTLCAAGLTRIDIIVVNDSGNVVHVAGAESGGVAVRPAIPANSVLVTQINVTDSAVGTPEDPLIGEAFVKKSFAQPYAFDETGTDVEIALDPLGREEIRLTNASLESIKGFNLSLITVNPSAEQPYIGKRYRIRNITGVDITLKHNDLTAGLIFLARNSADVVIPNNEELEVIYAGGGFAEGFRSWSSGGSNVILFDANIPQLTGTTDTTKIKDCVVPANTIPENCMLRLTWQVMWNKSTNYKFFYSTLNSINVNLGIIVNYIATNTNNTSFEIQEIQRNCVVKNGNLYVVKNSNLRSGYTTSLAEINSIDVTQDNTFNIWGKLNDGADNLDVLGFAIEKLS